MEWFFFWKKLSRACEPHIKTLDEHSQLQPDFLVLWSVQLIHHGGREDPTS
jgi:hypothetical protein